MSDPLIGWTLERDVWVNIDHPHRLDSPGNYWHGSLTDAEADQFERAKAITAAWAAGDEAQRFTAKAAGVRMAGISDGNYTTTLRFRSTSARDAFVAQINRPAPPADDLPEGVSWVLIADGSVVRGLPDDEWERRLGTGWVTDRNAIASPGITYIVRRRPTPPPPAVERVPWWEAVGRKDDAHQTISTVGFGSASACPFFITSGGLRRNVTAADGTVEVLKDGAE